MTETLIEYQHRKYKEAVHTVEEAVAANALQATTVTDGLGTNGLPSLVVQFQIQEAKLHEYLEKIKSD